MATSLSACLKPLAWGLKASSAFRDRIRRIASDLRMPLDGPDWLMACIAWESGETFSPAIRNGAGSGATGLIQFMPATARALGTTVQNLAQMTAEGQLEWVAKYFAPYKGRLNTLSDVYMAILWPAAIGKPENYVLWYKDVRPTTYRQNIGLDVDHDGDIEKQEAAFKVRQKLVKGLRAPFVA